MLGHFVCPIIHVWLQNQIWGAGYALNTSPTSVNVSRSEKLGYVLENPVHPKLRKELFMEDGEKLFIAFGTQEYCDPSENRGAFHFFRATGIEEALQVLNTPNHPRDRNGRIFYLKDKILFQEVEIPK